MSQAPLPRRDGPYLRPPGINPRPDARPLPSYGSGSWSGPRDRPPPTTRGEGFPHGRLKSPLPDLGPGPTPTAGAPPHPSRHLAQNRSVSSHRASRDGPQEALRDAPRDGPRSSARDPPRDSGPRDVGPRVQGLRDGPRDSSRDIPPRDGPRDGSRDGPRDAPRDRDSSRSRDGSRGGSWGLSRPGPRDVRRDTSRGTSSSARQSGGVSGQSPVRSSGASRELIRRQQSSSHISSPSKLKPAAVRLEATASTDQKPAASVSVSEAPPPVSESAPVPELPPAPVIPAKPEPISTFSLPIAAVIQAHSVAAAVTADVSAPEQTTQVDVNTTASTGAAASVAEGSSNDKPAPSMEAAAAAAVVAVTPVEVAQPLHERPAVEEPQPKRPKPFLFGRGLASRKSAAQAELTLPETVTAADPSAPTVPVNNQQAQAQAAPANAHPVQDVAQTEEEALRLASAQIESSQQRPVHALPAVHAEPSQLEAESREAALPPLHDLLARNSPNSMVRSSYAQIAKDLQALQTHKTQLESSIKDFVQEEQECSRRAGQAQALRDAHLREQQQQQQQREKAAADEAQVAHQLGKTRAEISKLRDAITALPPVVSEVSQSEEEDASISSQDESQSDADEAVPMDVPATRQSQAAAASSNGDVGADLKAKALVQKLQAHEQANGNLAFLLNQGQSLLVSKQVGTCHINVSQVWMQHDVLCIVKPTIWALVTYCVSCLLCGMSTSSTVHHSKQAGRVFGHL